MSAEKAAERSNLILQLGHVLRPLTDLAVKSPPPDATEYRIVNAQFRRDIDLWDNEASRFVIVGGTRFDPEFDDIRRGQYRLYDEVNRLARDNGMDSSTRQQRLVEHLAECRKQTLAAIDQVPISWESRLLESATPFATSLRIADAIKTARRRIHYIDRYLDHDFFPLYLRDISRAVEIRLVTTRGNADYGTTSVAPLARLASREFADFRLVECTPADVHDRNLRIDDSIFHLGPSVSQAGRYPTNFSVADSSATAHQILDDLIRHGTVVV